MSIISLSLYDAANNCAREGATAVLTLRSGVQFEGELEKPTNTNTTSAHLKTKPGPGRGGWVTILVDEIVAVEARP